MVIRDTQNVLYRRSLVCRICYRLIVFVVIFNHHGFTSVRYYFPQAQRAEQEQLAKERAAQAKLAASNEGRGIS